MPPDAPGQPLSPFTPSTPTAPGAPVGTVSPSTPTAPEAVESSFGAVDHIDFVWVYSGTPSAFVVYPASDSAGKPSYTSDGEDTPPETGWWRKLHYVAGNYWIWDIYSDGLTYNQLAAAAGDEDFPWQADWSDDGMGGYATATPAYTPIPASPGTVAPAAPGNAPTAPGSPLGASPGNAPTAPGSVTPVDPSTPPPTDAVRYSAQSGRTEAEKLIALSNIGAQQATAIDVRSYGAVGDGVTDDTAALSAAFAAARAGRKGLALAPNSIYRTTSVLTIDWDCTVEGNYSTIKPQTASQVALMLGNAATGPHLIELNNLYIEGTGAANWQILIDTPDTGTKMVTMRNCKLWFGGTGMRCNLMDYLRMERCWLKGSITNLHFAKGVRAATITGGGFGDATSNPVTPTTQTHVLSEEAYGVTFINVEWGDGVTGIKIQNATNKVSMNVTFIGCRMERVRGNIGILSDDTTGGKVSPVNMVFEQCEIQSPVAAMTNNAFFHMPGGGGPFIFRQCSVSQAAASQSLVWAQSSNAYVVLENCVISGGASCHILKKSDGTFSDLAKIVDGKNDASVKVAYPFQVSAKLGTISSTRTEMLIGQMHRSMKVTGFTIFSQTALSSSATDYWVFALKRSYNGGAWSTIATYNQQNAAVPAYARRGVTASDTQTGDNIVWALDVMKNGSAATLTDLVCVITYEPF